MPGPLECPEIDCWEALFDDTVPPDQWECYERHLESCPACQKRLDQAEAQGDTLQRLARQGGDPTVVPADPTLVHVVERLVEGKGHDRSVAVEPADLYFLRPSDRPGVLGTLGDYEVQDVIGQGGMGVVLKAFDPALHRLVAIKVMAAAVAGSPTARRRFSREAQAAAAVCHDHVVTVHGVHAAEQLPYLVMQYVAGESLQARLDRSGPLELVEIVRIGFQTASGLAAAHAQGLIHRDIKPANLLLENGLARVRITDFGLARMVDDVGLTQQGVLAGTPEYMAPEQARGESVDHRADLFSLGSVLYAMCTGVPPFRGTTMVAVTRQVSDQEPTLIRSLNPDVPAWLEAIVARLMAKNPADRFQSAAEVANLLEGYLAHQHQPATAPAPALPFEFRPSKTRLWSRAVESFRRHPRLALSGSLAGLALSIVSLLALLAPGQARLEPNQATFYQDFREGQALPPCFWLIGSEPNTLVRPEKGGLRITVPANKEQKDRVGLEMFPTVRGKFEITVGYEIISADRPTIGEGLGVEFYIGTTPMVDGLGVMRLSRLLEGDVYMISRSTNQDGNLSFKQTFIPSTAKSGRLRMTRNGAEVTAWAAEGTASDFKELCRYDLGQEDVGIMWLTAFVGASKHGVDVRLLDLKIVADGVSVDAVAPPVPGPGKTGRKGWLAAGAIIGLLIAGSFLGMWLYARRNGKTSVVKTAQREQAAPTMLSVTCTGCKKTLRVKPELAGKRGKCPHCGQALTVPGSAPEKRRPQKKAWLLGGILLAGISLAAGLWAWGREPTTKSFLNVPLGRESVPGVEEAGFYFQEHYKNDLFRWTNGNARLTIAVESGNPPQTMEVLISPVRPRHVKEVRLQITANQRDLFNEMVPTRPWKWQRTFDLAGIDLGEALVLDIVSDTFIPKDDGGPKEDSRILGVQVKGITLLRNELK